MGKWKFHNNNSYNNSYYSIDLTESKIKHLWEELKKYKDSHEEFYFAYVNPYKYEDCKK